ncbi:Gfo/Idh/MocA family protein [Marinilactibacillus kalidii]|uniref:Gfo/Idh/MocA family protein n=1 Tax=Marinilactibacillus kalidii TaxID=2820274 RepID=UPI001ABE56BC|nr:Gfo/Idh/MocA family oxidoreductase [Marinilactibacillus kalidii]
MEKFGWAYIGCGGIAQGTASELIQTEDNQIVAVWNRTQSKADTFAKKFGGTVYDTAEEAINAPGVEGVYVNVNGDQHGYYTELAIKNGKAVLCEKPFTVNAEASKALFDYAKKEHVYVSEAMWTWHNEIALQVKEWIRSGMIGDIVSADSAFEVALNYKENPRLTTPSMLGGALMDLGVYNLRYSYELFGLPESVQCEGEVDEVDYKERVVFQYPNFESTMNVSMTENGGHYFNIKGTKGSISVPQFHMAKEATLTTEDGEKTIHASEELLYGKQFSNVAKEIRSGKTEGQKVSAQSTIEVMDLLDECRRQMELVYPQEKD